MDLYFAPELAYKIGIVNDTGRKALSTEVLKEATPDCKKRTQLFHKSARVEWPRTDTITEHCTGGFGDLKIIGNIALRSAGINLEIDGTLAVNYIGN